MNCSNNLLCCFPNLCIKYSKRVLGLIVLILNRLVYLCTSRHPIIYRRYQNSVRTPSYPCVSQIHRKVWAKDGRNRSKFYTTRTTLYSGWKGIVRTNRHTITPYSVRGFHHTLYKAGGFHTPVSVNIVTFYVRDITETSGYFKYSRTCSHCFIDVKYVEWSTK